MIESIWDGFTRIPRLLFSMSSIQLLSRKYFRLVVLSFILSAGCFHVVKNDSYTGRNDRKRLISFMLFALIWFIAGVLPFVVIEDTVALTHDLPHADRAYLAAMPGFCLFTAALFHLISLGRRQYALFISVIACSFCLNLLIAHQQGVEENAAQQDFFRQVATRAGGLQPNTAFVSDAVLFPNQGNFATAAAMNLLFPDEIEANGEVPFWIFGYPARTYEQHGGFHAQKRIYKFTAPKTNMIYLDRQNKFGNCVWFFDPEDTDNPHVSDLQRSWIEHSAVERIDTGKTLTADPKYFGKTEMNWCWYYQTAERLLQQEDWNALADLTEKALETGFTPEDERSDSPFEWWPFIAGTYTAGNRELADELAARAVLVDPAYQEFYASRIERL